jgi:hypothetical protein
MALKNPLLDLLSKCEKERGDYKNHVISALTRSSTEVRLVYEVYNEILWSKFPVSVYTS